jgi:hypothetical protein
MSDKNTKTFHADSGKGDRPRAYSVTQEEFCNRFDAIDWSKKSAEESGCSTAASESPEAAEG